MIAAALAGAWLSYAVFYYGLSQVRAGHGAPLPAVGFLDCIWPGKWAPPKKARR